MRYPHVIKERVCLEKPLNHLIKIFRVIPKIINLGLESFGKEL